jgi:hypothetical protein
MQKQRALGAIGAWVDKARRGLLEIASRTYPACARKKPISGRPEIGAYLVH